MEIIASLVLLAAFAALIWKLASRKSDAGPGAHENPVQGPGKNDRN